MQANIKGLVDRLELSQAKAMMPLYEAISNAVDAIEEHQDGFINHSIRIRLVASNDLAHQGGDGTLVVDGFDVIDDGVGFNDKNLASFKEAHTLSKVKLGGRGVGRFTFLKVFSSVRIRSVFKREGQALLREFDFSYDTLVTQAMDTHALGERLLAPGSLLADPLTALSLSLGLVFGTAGLPHILMRFFTVSDAREARKSVLYATGFIGYFFNVIFLLGLASIVIVSQQPQYFEGGQVGGKLLGGGNMVVMHLAHAVGGNLLLGFLSAVTFATILAVVSGLALAGASAIAHDLYARVIMKGAASESQELRVTKLATLGLGLVAIALGIVFENINVAFMVALAFGIAASANFPVLFLSMFWSGLTTRGALAGGYVGLVSAMGFVVFSRLVWVDVLHFAEPLFPYTQPALFSMPLAFAAAYGVSRLDRTAQAKAERAAFADQFIRGQTGLDASGAVDH